MTLVTLVTRNRTLEKDYKIMESVWEKEIRELLDSLMSESLDDLLKEIMEAPIFFTDSKEVSIPRRTRKRKNTKKTF